MLASAGLLCGFLMTAWGADKDADLEPNGRPQDYRPGQSLRYVIWHDGNGWQMRMTGPKGAVHKFNGTVEAVDGKFTNVRPVNAETNPQPMPMPNPKTKPKSKVKEKAPEPADVGVLNPEKTIFRFTMNAGNGSEDGIHIQMTPETKSIKFTLDIDGKDHVNQIFIGSKGDHPEKATFILPANPPKEKSK